MVCTLRVLCTLERTIKHSAAFPAQHLPASNWRDQGHDGRRWAAGVGHLVQHDDGSTVATNACEYTSH